MITELTSLLASNLSAAPKWFSGVDCLFEVIAIVVTLLISIYVYRLHKFSKQEKYYWMSLSFVAICLAFVARVFTNSFFYNHVLERYASAITTLTLGVVQNASLLYLLGNLGFRFLMLTGLLGVYFVIESSQEERKGFLERINKKHLFLFVYLIASLVLLSTYKALVFHITAALLLCFISYVLIRNYVEVGSKKTLCVAGAFLTLLASQMIFILIVLSNYAYVVAEIVQLVGFGLLLASYYSLAK